MKKNVRGKAVYLKPEIEVIQFYSDVHFLAGSGVSAETGNENVGNIFNASIGQGAKEQGAMEFGSLWENDFEDNNE
ncbi:MAG TPA: hypothetical protein VIQ97_01430, partial [Prevotella sp.]